MSSKLHAIPYKLALWLKKHKPKQVPSSSRDFTSKTLTCKVQYYKPTNKIPKWMLGQKHIRKNNWKDFEKNIKRERERRRTWEDWRIDCQWGRSLLWASIQASSGGGGSIWFEEEEEDEEARVSFSISFSFSFSASKVEINPNKQLSTEEAPVFLAVN